MYTHYTGPYVRVRISTSMNWPPKRENLEQVLAEWVPSFGLRRHMYSVEVAVRGYAERHNEDPDSWGAVALFHDLDYEKYPTESDHPYRAVDFLKGQGWPDWALKAILSHADYTDTPRESMLEKVLYACDEITGLIVATALVRPDQDIKSVKVKSVKKKWKQKSFAAGVNRDDVIKGCEDLGVELWEHVGFVLECMQSASVLLELDGNEPDS